MLSLVASERDQIGDEVIAKFIVTYMKRLPTILGLTQLIDPHIDNTRGIAKQNLTILRSFAEVLVAIKLSCQCQSRGFKVKKMVWHCPSGENWATIKTIFGLEGNQCIDITILPFLGEALPL